LNAAFLDNWNEADDWAMHPPEEAPPTYTDGVPVQVVCSSSTVEWTETANLIRTLIALVRDNVTIVTPYRIKGSLSSWRAQ